MSAKELLTLIGIVIVLAVIIDMIGEAFYKFKEKLRRK